MTLCYPKRMRMLVVLLLLFFTAYPLQASPDKNVLFISIDGLSRDTLYALLNKGSLPNIRSIVKRGNYRNMDLPDIRPNTLQAYHALFSGALMADTSIKVAGDPIEEGSSVFERLENNIPNLTTVALISEPLDESSVPSLNSLLIYAKHSIDIIEPIRRRSLSQISRDSVRLLNRLDSPFFMFVNVTNVDYVGRNYREGSDTYSTAVKRADRFVGGLIGVLEEKGLWEDTEIVLTTQYGYRKNSQILSSEVWVASTQKIRLKGTSLDIVPTIYKMYGLNYEGFHPKLMGTALIY
jgi:hypothetical protein